MNGADATAAAGLNTTKANWSYTGPGAPRRAGARAPGGGQQRPGDIHMAATGLRGGADLLPADQCQSSTSSPPARRWHATPSPAAAEAAGYVAVSPTTYPVVYYVNPDH